VVCYVVMDFLRGGVDGRLLGHAFGLNMGPSLLTDLRLDRLKQGLILPSLS
jgi:hypothetical protein